MGMIVWLCGKGLEPVAGQRGGFWCVLMLAALIGMGLLAYTIRPAAVAGDRAGRRGPNLRRAAASALLARSWQVAPIGTACDHRA